MFDIDLFPIDSYDYRNSNTDVSSIIHSINLLGNDLIGAEIGVFQAESFLALLHNCPTIKTLYGVDSYQPYTDYLRNSGYADGTPMYRMGQKEIEYAKLLSYHRQKYSGFSEKINFLEMDSNDAAKKIEDDSLDFIFIDTYLTYQQAVNDLSVWYPKVKSGGLFAGHDWISHDIKKAVTEYRANNNIHSVISIFDNVWMWKK